MEIIGVYRPGCSIRFYILVMEIIGGYSLGCFIRLYILVLEIIGGYRLWCFIRFYILVMEIIGGYRPGCSIRFYILVMEIIGRDWRVQTGVFYQIFFSVGFMLLPVMAYYIRDSRNLQIALALIPVITWGFPW